ncbi:CoA pyrophosphatase [Alphaproteobacteria bacterium]|nr:CoA pyrophosphatase [Alphaproteobacteria bacterium]
MTSAAVLVPLIDHATGMSVLLTQRTENLPDHAGQIAFPGGRQNEEDLSPEDTALRETEEEVGIHRTQIQLVGRLTALDTRTGYYVMPVIGVIDPPLSLTPEPTEVAQIFEVPLDFVLDPANHRLEPYKGAEAGRQFRAIPYGEHYIWGLTARVLFELANVLRKS